jgi:FixJ family two-component response regulator
MTTFWRDKTMQRSRCLALRMVEVPRNRSARHVCRCVNSGCPVLPGGNLVLVVDDDRAVLKALKRVLRQHGFDTILIPSADAFKKHSDFDEVICIILDLDLKDGSSIPLRRELKANRNSVPVIYITGNDSESVRKAALQSGCIDYLVKPFSAKSLIESVKLAGAWPV